MCLLWSGSSTPYASTACPPTTGQLRETLSTLLHAAPPSATPYWLALLGEVALSSTAAAAARSASGPSGSVGAAAAQQPSRPAGGGVEREFDREDDDEEGAGRGIGAGRRAPDQAAAARGGGGGLAGAAGRWVQCAVVVEGRVTRMCG